MNLEENIYIAMGILGSKVEVHQIERLEVDVVGLIIKLNEEEVKMDEFVQKQLCNSLKVYSEMITKITTKGYLSQRKARKLTDLVNQAEQKLQHLPTQNIFTTMTDVENPRIIREKLGSIRKLSKNNQIKPTQCTDYMETVTAFLKKLDTITDLPINQEEQNENALMLLHLFLKSPPVKVFQLIEKSHWHLEQANRCIESINAKKVRGLDLEEVKSNLEVVKLQNERIKESSVKTINVLEQITKDSLEMQDRTMNHDYRLASIHPTLRQNGNQTLFIMLQELDDYLNEYEKVLDNFCAPIGDLVVSDLKQKLNGLLNQLEKVPEKERSIREKKAYLLNRHSQILSRLERIIAESKEVGQKLRLLKNIEDQLSSAAGTSVNFQEKITLLNALAKEVEQISAENEVAIQKQEIANRIEALIIAESSSYLRQLKKTIDYNKKYVQEFAFSKSDKLYEEKINEICSLKRDIDAVLINNQFIEDRKTRLVQEINVVLQLLSEKVNQNEEVLLSLQYLDVIQNQISCDGQTEKSGLEKLQAFNNIRKRIVEDVGSFHQRLSRRKLEIVGHLHVLEIKVYSSELPQEITEIKMLLNEREISTLEFGDLKSNEYKVKKQEIKKILNNFDSLVGHHITQNYRKVLHENGELILVALKQRLDEMQQEDRHDYDLKSLRNHVIDILNSDLSTSVQIQLCHEQLNVVKAMRNLTRKRVVLNAIQNTETMIAVETSSIKLPELKTQLTKIHQSLQHLGRPLDKVTFFEKIGEIFYIKELVEDMPKGNSDLDGQKQAFLQKVLALLTILDGQVANVVVHRKHPDKTLQLQGYFTSFNPNELKVKKESVEFVRIIQQRAQSFEQPIRNYLGTNDSVEYYILHENLMRMLEELDRLSIEDKSLLNATVEALYYIKNLIAHLESNASTD